MSEIGYIPYEATAVAEVDAAGVHEIGRRIFPDATPSQLQQMHAYMVGIAHNALEIGLACSSEKPTGPLEAYRLGVKEGNEEGYRAGYEQALREIGRNDDAGLV
jgi:hypothetical protein